MKNSIIYKFAISIIALFYSQGLCAQWYGLGPFGGHTGTILSGQTYAAVRTTSNDGAFIVYDNQWNSQLEIQADYNLCFNHLKIGSNKDLLMIGGGDIYAFENSNIYMHQGKLFDSGVMEFKADNDNSGDNAYHFLDNSGDPFVSFNGINNVALLPNLILSGNLSAAPEGHITLENGQVRDKGVMEFRADLNNTGHNLYQFLDNTNSPFVTLNGVAKTITVPKLILNGELVFSSQETQKITSNKGLVFQIGNIQGSHFSIQNPLGTSLLYASLGGNVGIGTSSPSEKLHVSGVVKASSFVADASSFPDYVFEDDYELLPLSDVSSFVKENKHLPGMPTEQEIINNGMDIKEVSIKSVEKIEELYLYIILLEEQVLEMQKKIKELSSDESGKN